MLSIFAAFGTLLGGLAVLDPFGVRSDGDADEQSAREADIEQALDEDISDFLDLEENEAAGIDVAAPAAAEAGTTATEWRVPGGEIDGHHACDAVPGQHLSDSRGGDLSVPLRLLDDGITGGSDEDLLTGSERSDLIMGNDGSDTLSGGYGADYLDGGSGDDVVRGGRGDDHIVGDTGDDILAGADGDDLIDGGDGDDTLYGGDGDDRLFGQLGADMLKGGGGNDLLDGTYADEGVYPDGGDTLMGEDGDDILALGQGDVAFGGDGADLYLFSGPGIGAFGTEALADLPRVADFDIQHDMLEILIEDGRPGEIATRAEDGGLTVLIDGQAVARLDGLTSLDPALIRFAAA
ncbi:calcium-binding protein [Jannaschia aquimarina]|uniref:HlyA_4 protein n=1 Tax=Jannaschia aquimarina TaxID=935700 RepID=A0A0D1EI17_9RHOB|nr:hypothetical protein [Jannaschia aquimarina]KIT15490.1 Hemolysin, plasmid [Jannaschia aquimarina]SNT34080.1 Hemolysin-type calcium-binding repeat-containing protein [Jannaschia aquimarina]